ncbi:DsbA family protein [Flavisolibacter ginsenosidimutans]|uniref:DsbA family protein n=1 Tax=Flavisolibacter ginsenosidimutans TaxID=661481 RepID=A0A5B8UM31_9BACT|nr:DsbA family protein [Flavisolibacter ginsenosidimutans]QEC57239.1 DsbA family protein [Flavisolibacter ginsenosidimutans]
MKPLLIYCYDAYCGWCYGFSKVIVRIEEEYRDKFDFDVFSGGMILPEKPQHFASMAKYIQGAYKRVEELTGIKFGDDFLWHVFHPDETDWFPSSEMPAIALCIMKEYHPDKAVQMASDLQYALNYEGRDLTDGEAYRHLLPKYNIPEEAFYTKLKSEEYKEKAHYEFALVKQLQVTGFPTVLAQVSDSKFYLLAQGYTDYETLKERIEKVLSEPDV